jgi:hypothetical protein
VVNTNTIGLLTMSSISEDAALEVGARNGRKLEGSGETLLTLRIVILKSYLKFNGFYEVTLLSLEFFSSLGDGLTMSICEDIIDTLLEEGRVKLS